MTLKLCDGSEFLHIPKTGGSWVTKVLENNGLIVRHVWHKHADFDANLFLQRIGSGRAMLATTTKLAAEKIKRNLGIAVDDVEEKPCFRFCFVRHPLSWYESWWKYMKGRKWSANGKQNSFRHWHPNSILNGLGDEDFNTFVRNVVRIRPGYVSELYFSFAKPGLSFIGKTENLTNDLIYVLKSRGFSIDVESIKNTSKVNVSEKPPEEIRWDQDLKETVMRLELPALSHFGYLSPRELSKLGISADIKPNESLRRIPARAAA